ncbi:MAG: hypothetical protein GYA24_21940 [Candidatus Lokiarchaeota archaeon]|nr:hypothetical protein [Candidatus Lokiarchaeota archaeon]
MPSIASRSGDSSKSVASRAGRSMDIHHHSAVQLFMLFASSFDRRRLGAPIPPGDTFPSGHPAPGIDDERDDHATAQESALGVPMPWLA